MSALPMESSTALPEAISPETAPALQPADFTQDAVERALESGQRLIAELRSARFAALSRHARETRG